ncbi:PKD domain-containing protein [Kineobactrum salinum]|uniref:PKD domain-containing protein n=1 Tax=Kineobactrum salinum TaxID=2708301 RepID=A0A6C0U9D0_9GAMM|nr:hypothetical protein [Kineobactrum salinum]QIB66254.1 hypothetical protein G3T16_13395 [Kineobactrum salinum]
MGKQADAKPEAMAQLVGASASTTGTVNARAGAEVLLTGKDSEGYDDPILTFSWRQVDDSGVRVDLVERTANSRAFSVPAVTAPTTLSFELTVTDSENESSTDRVNVRVEPVADADLFLRLKVTEPALYQYALVVGREPGEAGAGEFVLRLDTVARWPDRNGDPRQRLISSETIRGQWPQQASGAGAIADSPANPRFLRRLPTLDADEINRHYEAEADRDLRLEPDQIDRAGIYLRVVLESFDRNARVLALTADGSSRELLATVNGVIDSGLVAVDSLHSRPGLESLDSANKYYALIDAPPTLAQWKARAGFQADPRDQPGVAHANYNNNYDLGFGREMYLRRDRDCGNVYSYVNNYPTLETALQGRNRFATVAMEYSPLDHGCHGDKLVKFYAFVPDQTTGEDVLARSMNFDGRGERFVPGVCVACHRGSVPDLSAIPLAEIDGLDEARRFQLAHLESSFIPWDMDALLFADDDPAITSDYSRLTEEQRQRNSRASQQQPIRAMNEAVLATYQARPERFAASIKLIHGWYGAYRDAGPCEPDGSDPMPATITQLPDQTFDGSFVQCGWRGEEPLYHEVFAKHCRSCHTQTDNLAKNFETAAELMDNASLLPFVFDSGSMPLARLTYDRFWVDFNNGSSAAATLAARLGLDSTRRPGRPLARFAVTAIDPASGTVNDSPRTGDSVRLDASSSDFAERFAWSLTSDCGSTPTLVGAAERAAAFNLPQRDCAITVTLEVSNAQGSDISQQTIASHPGP